MIGKDNKKRRLKIKKERKKKWIRITVKKNKDYTEAKERM